MRTVHYIAHYAALGDEDNYHCANAGILKMRYIKESIKKAGFNLNIFSVCTAKGDVFFKKGKKADLGNNEKVIYISSFPKPDILSKIFNRLWNKIRISSYFLFKIKKDDFVVLYHSFFLTKLISILKKIKNVKVIIEVEEIYSYADTKDSGSEKKEILSIKAMDKFITVNESIAKSLEVSDNSIVCYGVIDIPKRQIERFDDGFIHVVYAGAIEKRNSGAFTALEAAGYLPDNYVLHMLGSGFQEDINYLKNRINEINKTAGFEKIKYHGMLKGRELTDFLHKCNIGLSTYVLRDNFSNNSLPSKVTTYMCHELPVVIGYTKAFDDIEISKVWNYFYEFEPKSIAKAVTEVDINKDFSEVHKLLLKMDRELVKFFLNS